MPIETHKIVVVIPVYKSTLTHTEALSLKQCVGILKDFEIVIVKPKSLQLDSKFYDLPTKSFEDAYFKSVATYNKLMLTTEFYAAFLQYNFMLLYQLDAYVFRNDLLEWCNKGYDYIGAPWISTLYEKDFLYPLKKKIALWFKLKNADSGIYRDIIRTNAVGNGGFSLRNIHKFHAITISHRRAIVYYLSHNHHKMNEDIFWGIEVNRYFKRLNIPSVKVALEFAFEASPSKYFEQKNGKLPFGCHAFELIEPDFWKRFIDF